MTEYCDVERVIAEDRRLLIRRGDRFILVDLDEKPRHRVNWWAMLVGAMFWGLIWFAIHQAWKGMQ